MHMKSYYSIGFLVRVQLPKAIENNEKSQFTIEV